jgi:hypothetical protein
MESSTGSRRQTGKKNKVRIPASSGSVAAAI